jgi:hypothetical protein
MPCEQRVERGKTSRYSLLLTEYQRDTLVSATSLPVDLKARLRRTPAGAHVVMFEKPELEEMLRVLTPVEEDWDSDPTMDCITGVRHKLSALLAALDDDGPLPPAAGRAAVTETVFEIRLTIDRVTPRVWRLIQVPDITLGNFHHVIQVALGWTASRFHDFEIDGIPYAPQPPDNFGVPADFNYEDEDAILMSQVAGEARRFEYHYGLDDDLWEITVHIQGELEPEPGVKYPRCLGGKRASPLEDAGGAWGYENLLDEMQRWETAHEDDISVWVPDEFDSEAFSVAEVNRALRQFA